MTDPLLQSLSRIINKIRRVLRLYYTPTVWAELSNEKHGNAQIFYEALEPYAKMDPAYLQTSKLANAAFRLRQEIMLLQSKYALRATGLQVSPATLPSRGESRIPLTATPSKDLLDAALRDGRTEVAIICLIKLGILAQLHHSKVARKRHPGFIAHLTFSRIHGVGQYEGILSASDRTFSGFLRICDVIKDIDLNLEAADPNYLCAQLILLLIDVLNEITFDRELLRFNNKYHAIKPEYYLKSGIVALHDDKDAMHAVTNTFYSWLCLLAMRTIKLEPDQKYYHMQEALEALNREFTKLDKRMDPEFVRRFVAIWFKFNGIVKPEVPRDESSMYQVHEFEPNGAKDVVSVFEIPDRDVEAEWDPEWGSVTPAPDLVFDYFRDTGEVEKTPQIDTSSRSDLGRSDLPPGLPRSPRATTKVVPV